MYQTNGRVKNNKARLFIVRLCYIDGLVSTGNRIPDTILKRIFTNIKLFPKNFINIFSAAVDKGDGFCTHSAHFFSSLFQGVFCFFYFPKKTKPLKALILQVLQRLYLLKHFYKKNGVAFNLHFFILLFFVF